MVIILHVLILQVKGQLRGRRFDSIADLLSTTQSILSGLDETWFANVFDRWIHRHKRCVEAGGDYFEKN